MIKEVFFNSSMPRSGSTLLQNILGNRPDIYATPTSPLIEYLQASKTAYTKSTSTKAQDSRQMRNAFYTYCRYATYGFFEGLTDREYAIEKSRGWGVNYDFLNTFYPNPKIICLVRDLRDIIASMENNYRKNPDKARAEDSIIDRIHRWMLPQTKPVGNSISNLFEIFHRGLDKHILFVRFEDLTTNPQATMDKIHKFLEIKEYKYDFNNIKQVTFEDDKFHGIYGDHKINNVVTPVKSKAYSLLGEAICNSIYDRYQWYFEKFNYQK